MTAGPRRHGCGTACLISDPRGHVSQRRGVPQDYVQPHMWYNLAASRLTGEDRESAVEGRDVAAGQMTPDDRSEAQRLAREWDAAHPRDPFPRSR